MGRGSFLVEGGGKGGGLPRRVGKGHQERNPSPVKRGWVGNVEIKGGKRKNKKVLVL